MNSLLRWHAGNGPMEEIPGAFRRGEKVWGKDQAFLISPMVLSCNSIYSGAAFDVKLSCSFQKIRGICQHLGHFVLQTSTTLPFVKSISNSSYKRHSPPKCLRPRLLAGNCKTKIPNGLPSTLFRRSDAVRCSKVTRHSTDPLQVAVRPNALDYRLAGSANGR